MAEEFDVELSDGRKIKIDLSALTIKEWRMYWKTSTPDTECDAILHKVCGLPAKEIAELPYEDFRRISRAFFEKGRRPLNDPKNSGGASS